MNAIQFIRENGVEKAREVVEGAPFNSTCYVFWTGKFRYINELTCEIYSEKLGGWCEANIMVLNLKNPLSELKRLVESVDLVNSNGGWNGTKNTITLFQSSLDIGLYHGVDGVNAEVEIPRLKQAIADYESIYGGEHV